jgi:uncharacterized protein
MYVDSGVLLKLYVPEPESDAAQRAVARTDELVCSELLLAEFQSAISRKRREGQIDMKPADEFMAAFRRDVADGAISIVKLNSSAIEAAMKLLAKMPDDIPLRTLDAIHLGVCFENKLFPLLTTDAVMLKAAKHLRIPVVELPVEATAPRRRKNS